MQVCQVTSRKGSRGLERQETWFQLKKRQQGWSGLTTSASWGSSISWHTEKAAFSITWPWIVSLADRMCGGEASVIRGSENPDCGSSMGGFLTFPMETPPKSWCSWNPAPCFLS